MMTLEERTQEIGRELLERTRALGERIFSTHAWEERFLAWFMDDQEIRTRLLRFVDAFPALQTSKEIDAHLSQYLPTGLERLPLALRIAEDAMGAGAAPRAIGARVVSFFIHRMARRFICGETTGEAVRAIRKAARSGMLFTIDLLGEEVASEREADAYVERNIALLQALHDEFAARPLTASASGPSVNLSLKLSSLYSQFDPIAPAEARRVVLPRLLRILHRAMELGAFVNVDMEQYERRDLTIDLFEEALMEGALRDYPHFGIVAQAYLKDAPAALDRLLDLSRRRGVPFTVRLVKGAYWDYELIHARQMEYTPPVLTSKSATDAQFESMAAQLVAAVPAVRVAIASHNIRSMARALSIREAAGLADDQFELQMLYGMGDPIKAAIVEMKLPLRVYMPHGPLIPGMGYLVRRLLENTSNESFLKHSFFDDADAADLLQDPAAASSPAVAASRTPIIKELPMPEFRNHPLLDFALPEERRRFQEALDSTRQRFGVRCRAIIGGYEHTVRSAEDWLPSPNPSYPEQIVGWFARTSKDDATTAITTAADAFARWSKVPAEERALALERTADYVAERRYEYAAWVVHEAGKPWREADADVCEAIDFLRYYAAQMRERATPLLLQPMPGERNEYAYFPLGPGVVISPWNFPMAILTGMTAAALVAGNTVVMKPAEQTPVCAWLMFVAFVEGGQLPPGVLNFLPGVGEEVGPTLVEHPATAFVAFTGSVKVGLQINEAAARVNPEKKHVTRVIAEMGGKNAVIVDATADLDSAVAGVIKSAFYYAGQKCSAVSRVIVHESIYTPFVSRLREAAESLRVGPADDPSVQVGPVIDCDAVERIVKHGATRPAADSQFIAPTVVEVDDVACALAQEEIFGPVAALMRASNFDEAVSIANATSFALTAGLYSRTPEHIERARREVDAGNLYINRPITGAIVGRQPFGGFRLSGIGSKAGGPDYLKQFLIPRTYTENTMRHGFAPVEGEQ